MTTTTELLADIHARAAQATAGPWHTGEAYGAVVAPVTAPNAPHMSPDNVAAYGGALIGESIVRVEDRAFIANARTDVPRLLAAVQGVEHIAREVSEEEVWHPDVKFLARQILCSLAMALGAEL